MLSLARMVRRLRALFRPQPFDAALDEEIGFHLEMEERQLRAAGHSPDEARRLARLHFGNLQRARDESRDARGIRPLEDLLSDLRYGLRSLRRTPGFTVAALLTLALGVGGPAAIFGAVRGMLLKPLPYRDAGRVLFAWQHDRPSGNARQEVAPANWLDWRERNQSFETLAALEPYGLDWQSDEGPVYLNTWLASEGFFDLLGVRPLYGRTFSAEEHGKALTPSRRGGGDVVVLGYGIWRQRFGGDPAVVGRIYRMEGKPVQVIGVMPESFALPSNQVVWAPKIMQGWEATSRTSNFYTVVGRLKDGVNQAQAQADLDRVASQLAAEYPSSNAVSGVALVPLPDQVLGPLKGILGILLAAVGLVFLIACANLANLQLARATGRVQEFAVRAALGAGRNRVGRQLISESGLLTGLGCLAGFLLAAGLLSVVRGLAPPGLPRLSELKADRWVLGFSVLTAMLAGTLTGILPFGLAGRASLRAGLASLGRGFTAGRITRRIRSGLVVAQLAFSLMLLIGAGLLLRSFVTLLDVDRGFRSEGVGVLTVQTWGYVAPEQRIAFVQQTTERIGRLPGVRSAAVASVIPLSEGIGAEQAIFKVVGRPAATGAEPAANVIIASEGLFATLGIPLRRGRLFGSTERDSSPRVALITETMARQYWPGEDPLGKRITLSPFGRNVEREIVGVVGDLRRQALQSAAVPTVYLPFVHATTGANAFFVWTEGDPEVALPAVKAVLWEFNSTMPINVETTMERIVVDSVRDRRFMLTLLGLFAALAFGLAAVGIFGVMSYATAERTREIGVRMAFGARGSDIVRMVLREGGTIALAGIGLGLLGAAVSTRILSGLLYAVDPLDPFTFIAGALLLLGSALLAAWAPAARAARMDPVGALRSE